MKTCISTFIQKIARETKAPANFIKALNEDLALEYAAQIQYVNHAAMLEGPAEASFAKELMKHADEEFGHAKDLAERINYLGGEVGIDVDKIYTASTTEKMLEQDLDGERLAIKRYRERIQQAKELKDEGTVAVLKKILLDEEEHESDLETYLKK